MKQLFPNNIINQFLKNYRIEEIANIINIKNTISNWQKELKSGKLQSLKEEEIKSRFVTDFFGIVLGFNPNNEINWTLREEKKTKQDAALGYFFIDKNKDQCVAVVEIKDAKTDLDKPQNRKSKQTPIEQAFEYSVKMDDLCKWVIVSNIREIRFYNLKDKGSSQIYYLEHLDNEEVLKELLFLFYKDNFIKNEDSSRTENLLLGIQNDSIPKEYKGSHIVDELYYMLKSFEGINFVDPNYLATLYPFNILDDQVWHYERYNLLTLNSAIYNLFQNITIEDEEKIILTNKLKIELVSNNVLDFENKLKWIFQFLNKCLIFSITAIKNYKRPRGNRSIQHRHFDEKDEQITKSIDINNKIKADSVLDNFDKLEFDKFLMKLYSACDNPDFETLEYAYAFMLIDFHEGKKSYAILDNMAKRLKGKIESGGLYYLVNQNLYLLKNRIKFYYEGSDKQKIIDRIDSIDLDKVINNELDFIIRPYVRKYLIQLKENHYRYIIESNIDNCCNEILNQKKLYDNGGKMFNSSHTFDQLLFNCHLYYMHYSSNYVFYNFFPWFQNTIHKALEASINSYLTPEIGIKEIHHFIIHISIITITPVQMEKELRKISELHITDDDLKLYNNLLYNLLRSYYESDYFSQVHKKDIIKIFSDQQILGGLEEQIRCVFSNLFILFNKISLNQKETAYIVEALINFLKVETDLHHYNIDYLVKFILHKKEVFTVSQLYSILKIAIDGFSLHNVKYHNLLTNVCRAIYFLDTQFKIENRKLIKIAIAKCYEEDSNRADFRLIIHLLPISSEENITELLNAIESQLNNSFSDCITLDLYEQLLRNKLYDFDKNDYFLKYTEQIVLRGDNHLQFIDGKPQFKCTYLINYLLIVYSLNIDFEREEFKLFKNLGEFETWLINPIKYDYSKFDVRWLLIIGEKQQSYVFERMKNIQEIKEALKSSRLFIIVNFL